MTKNTKQAAKHKEERVKRQYTRPRLIEYGSVAKLTASGGTVSTFDGTVGMMSSICL
jgi:hypothetical protein